MSESPKGTGKDKNAGQSGGGAVWLAVALVVAFVVFAGLYSASTAQKKQHDSAEIAAVAQDSSDEMDEDNDDVEVTQDSVVSDEGSDPAPMAEVQQSQAFEEDAEVSPEQVQSQEDEYARLTSPRTLGDVNAPVRIDEYSSLTCGHCGHFHKEVFHEVKKDYIDTGKAYIVFHDFPLNAPALHASMIARCLPEARYADFVQLLFETQEDWAYKVDYLKTLKQNAMLAGLDEQGFSACLQNVALQKFITDSIEQGQKEHGVESTPTFILNGSEMIKGAQPYDSFKKQLDDVLAKTEPSAQ
ncbi:MAG: DsbA family protein [Alphaproteobacteria bacterium]|nr:DsbA family protein [Alphaproteobacteria bacterium]